MNFTIAIQIAREVRYKKRKTLLKIGTINERSKRIHLPHASTNSATFARLVPNLRNDPRASYRSYQ